MGSARRKNAIFRSNFPEFPKNAEILVKMRSLVIKESTENQFGRPKKIRSPRENPRSAPAFGTTKKTVKKLSVVCCGRARKVNLVGLKKVDKISKMFENSFEKTRDPP